MNNVNTSSNENEINFKNSIDKINNILLKKIIEIVEYKQNINQMQQKIYELKLEIDIKQKIMNEQKESFASKYNNIMELLDDMREINKKKDSEIVEKDFIIEMYAGEINTLREMIFSLKNEIMILSIK